MPEFQIVRLKEVDSTNRIAAEIGRPWQVFTAENQTAGRGRLNHRWVAPPGVNLAMSVVLPVDGWTVEQVSTLPLVVGYAVLRAVEEFLSDAVSHRVYGKAACVDAEALRVTTKRKTTLKWPNDILIDGRKVSGILCERHGDNVIAGIGVNVLPREFPPEIADTATSLFQSDAVSHRVYEKAAYVNAVSHRVYGKAAHVDAASCYGDAASRRVEDILSAVLSHLASAYDLVSRAGFAALYPEFAAVDHLKGQHLAVLQTDTDTEPIRGLCGGIAPDGSLDVGGRLVYAGEAHVLKESV